MSNASTPKVQATAPDGTVFTKAAVLRGYKVRVAVLALIDGAWVAKGWHCDVASAFNKELVLNRKGVETVQVACNSF